MKSDLDRLMQERELSAIVIAIDHNYSFFVDYLVGNVSLTRGLAMKKTGDQPTLFVSPMEVKEASASNAKVYSFNEVGWNDLLAEYEGDRTRAEAVFWGQCLKRIGVESGKVGVYGVSDLNIIIELLPLIQTANPTYQFVGDLGPTLFDEASTTKDVEELERLQAVADLTSGVLFATWDFINRHRAEGDTVIKLNGHPLTIGDVKRFVRRQLLDRELEDHEMIFAQGRDAGFPHSRGQDDMPLKLGEPIVFDLFPYELGGGYFHDTTRTWCIGYAPEEVQEIYHVVKDAFDVAVEAFNLKKPPYQVQEAVQDFFESKGHTTLRSNANTTEGYIHGLGHGIGLKVHENPRMAHNRKADKFEVGNVFTIEPGLYYPEKGMGVRLEDTVQIAGDGSLITLTNFHKDLVIPLDGDFDANAS